MQGQGQPTPDSQQSAPLSPDEKREGTFYIEKFSLSVETERLLREALQKEREFADRERLIANKEFAIEKARTALAQQEAVLEKERAGFYKNALEQVTKKPSLGCTLKRVITFGLSKCG